MFICMSLIADQNVKRRDKLRFSKIRKEIKEFLKSYFADEKPLQKSHKEQVDEAKEACRQLVLKTGFIYHL